MLFNSFEYILLFLPVVAIVYALLQKYRDPAWAQAWLLATSLFFYSYATKPAYVLLLLVSIVFNWQIARSFAAHEGQRRKRLLQLGLVANIALLCSFKYCNLLLSSLLLPPSGSLQDIDELFGKPFLRNALQVVSRMT
jgi:D-alanyl-lipoteichoic acid acyltransferase DltB (MBOAT superfamily)